MRRALIWILLTPVFVVLAIVGVVVARRPLPPPPSPPGAVSPAAADMQLPTFTPPEPREAPPGATPAANCAEGPAAAAAANAASLSTAAWSAFGRPELGWEIYAPHVATEIGAPDCGPDSPGFAAALAGWQASRHLAGDGVMNEPTLTALAVAWALQRPFVLVSRAGVCPDSPPDAALAITAAGETYGPAVKLRPAALAAWRRLTADARRERPAIARDPRLLTIMSGFRDPVSDAARCVVTNDCGNLTRSTCSAHRTGLAVDVYLGAAPGFGPDSSADPNRLAQSRGEAYRWLLANAGRYGFVNYAFEPWHWEWTGEPVQWRPGN